MYVLTESLNMFFPMVWIRKCFSYGLDMLPAYASWQWRNDKCCLGKVGISLFKQHLEVPWWTHIKMLIQRHLCHIRWHIFFVSITQQWYIESYPPIAWEWRFFASHFLSGYSLWKPMLWHTPLYFPPINVPWTVCVFGRFVSKLMVATVMLESIKSLQPRRNFYSFK